MPESAAYDSQRQQIFVSNVNDYAKDGNGFISKISADGKRVELKWLTGLNSPTGLTTYNGSLYIADFDELVIADIDTQQILQRIPAPDLKPSLNDVAISNTGQVFVTGSSSSTIYILQDDQLLVWKHNERLLKNANGLLVSDRQLVHGGLQWSVFDLESKQLSPGFKKPDATIRDIDGIATDGCGGYIVTLLDDPRLWRIDPDGHSLPLSELPINGIDIQRHKGMLFVPTLGGGLSVFKLSEKLCHTDYPHNSTNSY